mmetsp:Transcript_6840/g.17231  ORF Transcript_6840/g.17231 Transcript_6840/m.17231 type:complete len:85 (+) Transcript_6840:421-675(+)
MNYFVYSVYFVVHLYKTHLAYKMERTSTELPDSWLKVDVLVVLCGVCVCVRARAVWYVLLCGAQHVSPSFSSSHTNNGVLDSHR